MFWTNDDEEIKDHIQGLVVQNYWTTDDSAVIELSDNSRLIIRIGDLDKKLFGQLAAD